MKKILVVFLILAFSVLGCSSGSSKKGPPEYTYKWGAGSGVSVSSYKIMSLEGDEDPILAPVYSGSIVPPYGSIDYLTGNTVGIISIYTYLDGELVRSNYAVDPSAGIMSTIGPDNTIDIFWPKKTGVLHVTASYNEYTLTIPVHVYWAYTFDTLIYIDFDTMTIYPDGDDPAVDALLGGANFKAPYGYLTIPDALSIIATAPDGFYRQLPFNQEYWAGFFDDVSQVAIIKTNEGRYVKMRFISWGYGGITFCFWVSDINGVFSH